MGLHLLESNWEGSKIVRILEFILSIYCYITVKLS